MVPRSSATGSVGPDDNIQVVPCLSFVFVFDALRGRHNYIGAYPSDGMSHPLLYQIAEEAAERLPR